MISLSKKPIGIKISDNSVKTVQIEKKGGKIKILKLNQISLAPGIVKRGRIRNEEKLIEAFEELFLENESIPVTEKKIVFGLMR